MDWPADHGSINLFILFLPFAEISLRLVLGTVCWDTSNAKRHGVLNEFSSQFTLQGMGFWIEFFGSILFCFWCQVSNKFRMSKTLQLGFWLYYNFFILWFLIELLYLLIVDVKSFVFVVIKFMQPIKHQWDQSICYSFISVIFDGAANDILLHFCLGTHHICSCTLLTGFTISAVIASLLHFLYFLLLQTS